MSEIEMDEDDFLYKKEVIEAKEDLDKESREIVEKYVRKLSCYSKQEIAEKPRLSTAEYYQLKKQILPKMFPDRDVGLRDLRRVIRVHFYKGQVPDKALYKDASRGVNQW